MECFASHNTKLNHRCNLPRKFLDHALAEGHQFDKDQLLVCCVSDTVNNQSAFLAMNEFIDAPVIELPVEYLPAAHRGQSSLEIFGPYDPATHSIRDLPPKLPLPTQVLPLVLTQ